MRRAELMPESWIDAELTEDDQVVSALLSNAAAFALVGGAPLMLTETVENANDAIEDAKALQRRGPSGRIMIEIDTRDREIRVIDNGTGILQPIHVLKRPFKSLRRNVDYAHGQFGRGLQGFRGFCEDLFYVSRRDQPSAGENILDKGRHGGRTVKLHLMHNSRKGSIEVVEDGEFTDFAGEANGTVAIYKNWFPGEFERIDLEKLFTRLQHHFGELVRQGDVRIVMKIDGSEKAIEPLALNPEHGVSLQPIIVKFPSGKPAGKVVFNLYYCSQSFQHDYKKPYLLVDERPLGDSFLSEFPEFRDQAVWSSHYLTGQISCDFVKPNDLRLALEPGPEKDAFVRCVRDVAIELQRLVQDFQKKLFDNELKDEMNDLVVEMQRFLRDERVFDFRPTTSVGLLSDSEQPATLESEVGNGPAATIDSTSPEHDQIVITLPESGDHLPHSDKSSKSDSRLKDESRDEPIDPRLKGHNPRRRRLRRPSGFPIHFEESEFSEDMSWFEETGHSVIVNSAHPRFTFLRERSLDRGSDSTYYAKLRVYVIQRYLWEIVMFSGAKEDKGRNELETTFWDLNYKFFETRSF